MNNQNVALKTAVREKTGVILPTVKSLSFHKLGRKYYADIMQ